MVRHLIWVGTNDDCISHLDKLKVYFKINDFCLVNESNEEVFSFTKPYYNRVKDKSFLIVNNKTWKGDYYDILGNLILSSTDKNKLISSIHSNAMTFKVCSNEKLYIVNQILKIAADYALDYYATIRSFEPCENYVLTKSNFNEGYKEFIKEYHHSEDECLLGISQLINSISGDLIKIVSEYGCIYELSYNMLSIEVTSGVMSLYTNGDWRIKQWEIANKEKQKENVDSRSEIEEAIRKEHESLNRFPNI